MYKVEDKEYECPVEITLDFFNDRWKLAIIWHLLDGKKRFKDLHAHLPQITQKTLTIKLRELEEKKLIIREVYAEVPPRVEYSLSEISKKLQPLLEQMYKWGEDYAKEFGEIICKENKKS